ncbi:RagB/SusD family nutrient uptake outer membrane protein [Flammeovirga sp. SubArs3]|uniref:RagB/SusD family nutrient uptake outer membrane protein n=1 Tax=Flammeovirga sp. SubArs3 TaxID=2995316 RepID=UPI00248B122A|nr:RagB/SusD family nutrient uptake outer membrane protein [Flammeovirga sp. SubArs3]
MKNNQILKYIILPLLILSSCTIKEEPPLADKDLIYQDVTAKKAVLDGVYALMIDFPAYKQGYHDTKQTHSGILNSKQSAQRTTFGSLNMDPTFSGLDNSWNSYYSAVFRLNQFLYDVPLTEESTDSERDLIGNAHFLRAFQYFHIVRSWGDVPLVTSPTSEETIHNAKSSKSDVYKQIIADLNVAIDNMSEAGIAPGYPSVHAAEFLLAKVYMWIASAEDSGEEEMLISGIPFETDTTTNVELTYWQSAKAHADKVYGMYSLVPNYNTLFDAKEGNQTSESIFELNFNSEVAQVSYTAIFTPNNYTKGLNNYGRIVVNPEVYTKHINTHPTDPRFINNYLSEYIGYARDQATGEVVESQWPTVMRIHTENRLTLRENQVGSGYGNLTKHIIKDRDQTTLDSPQGFIIYRYADLLLMLAEIENELGNSSQGEVYLNEVLERARNSAETPSFEPEGVNGLSQVELRERIYNEREFELIGEGEDWYEARRRGFAFFTSHVIEPHNNFIYFNENIDVLFNTTRKGMLLPIPLNEITNNQKMTSADQNFGY